MPDLAAKPEYFQVDFDQTPFVVAWETTRACALACRHCRAEAIPRRDPRELSTEEGYRLIDDLVRLGRPMLILTGGDPFMRPDIADLARYATQRGLYVGLSPSATARVTEARLRQVAEAGARMVHLSLDGLEASHDAFRGVRGSYQRTLEIMALVRRVGLGLQVGTTATRLNADELPALAELLLGQDVQVWNVFFLVPTGRAQRADMLPAERTEAILEWLWRLSKRAPFRVRTTAAQHYRRVVIQQERLTRGLDPTRVSREVDWQATGAGYAYREGAAPRQQGVNDGKGFAFVSHLGEVYPSGFLQQSVGSVRETSIVELYRRHPLFVGLREPDRLRGRCGRCEFKAVCGGSRARAWALTGDPFASDPACAYRPA